ncbi:uncharacterized protein [Rutidosis leptorrhynchoides]|uniref:uncharacterized protein n=1 Tax=Rutidosis leptorrhynchoides TaxID=125765 RepID=UPI003A99CF37
MGKWNFRRPRFQRQRRDWPLSYDREPLIPRSGFTDEGVPAWEKKFCALVGLIPWQKVLDTEINMPYLHKNVDSWEASAAEEAFRNAKNRFWAKENALPCDIPLPDPDKY